MTHKTSSQEKTPAEDTEGSPPSQKKPPAEGTQGADGKSNYVVGFGRPPVHSRFKKGHRSRGGRPKGQRNMLTVLRVFANERITFSEGNFLRTHTKRDSLLLNLLNRAVAGDDKAVGRVLPMLEADEDAQASKQQGFTTNDQAVIEEFMRRHVNPEQPADNASSQKEAGKDPGEPKKDDGMDPNI